MEFVVELLVNVVGEVLFEALGWSLSKRWGRLTFGVLLGFGGGLLWSVGLRPDDAPVLATGIVVAQAIAVAVVVRSGRVAIGSWQVRKEMLVDLVVIGAAVVGGRWAGWAV